MFFLAVLGAQWFSSVYKSEAGHYPDEAAHFMSALAIRDYLVSGFSTPPFQFAKNYYLHYPKFAIGMFPPLFHVLLGLWLLLGPGTYHGALIFLGLIMACIAWQVYRLLSPDYGVWVAAGTGLALIFLPLMQQMVDAVMVDSLVALFGLLVARYTAKYLETEENRDGVFLGIYAAAGCLVKGNGVGALLCPALAVILTGRYRVLRRPGLYIAAAIVLTVAAPLEWISLAMYRKNSSFAGFSLSLSRKAATIYADSLWHGVGGLVVAAIAAGMILKFLELRRNRDQNTLWPSIYALILGSLVFHIVVSHFPGGRYLATAVAAMMLFVPVTLARLRSNLLRVVTLGVLVIVSAMNRPAPDLPMGFGTAVEGLKQEQNFDQARFLVVSDSLGEGAFISEVASMDRRRPHHVVVRASKLLSRSDWNSTYYSLRFRDTGEVLQLLEDLGVNYVVLDRTQTTDRAAHQIQMMELVEGRKDRVSFEMQWPAVPEQRSRSIALYRLKFAAEKPKARLQYFLDSTLGIELNL